MRRLAILLLLLLPGLTATASHAQEGRRIPTPRRLVAQVMRDVDDGDDLAYLPDDSVAAYLNVTRRDLNGDGTPELMVQQTHYCGTNCMKWIYRRLPDGGYRMLLGAMVINLDVLPARVNGWHSISTWYHLSCCEGSSTRYEFDGRTYAWRETKWQREAERDTSLVTIYRVSITSPGTARRHLSLDPLTAGGVRIDAGYDVCRRGVRCGEPWLRLVSARLPAGRVCVGMSTSLQKLAKPYERSWTDCGVATETRAGGRTTRTLVLHPTRAEWGMLWVGYGLHLSIPGVRATIVDAGGIGSFAGRVSSYYHVVCPDGYGCEP